MSFASAEHCDSDIVITGVSGQFPNSRNAKEYVDQLMNKINLCDDDERRGKIDHPEIPKINGKIYNVDDFDSGNFGFHSFHTVFTDPMGRIFLEEVYSALFDAGIHPKELKGTKTGIFTGGCCAEYELGLYDDPKKNTNYIAGVSRSMNPQRVSYCLQVNGPAYNCDTACSSGMYALAEGYRAIREGRCDRAIIGGTNLVLNPYLSLQFARLGLLNTGCGCRPFDNDASGYTRSEAIVAVILQKRPEAKRIYGSLVHIKANSDGFKSKGITYPGFEGQSTVLNDVYSEANIDPKQIGFLEAHATGTRVGDPEESAVIEQFFKPTKEEPLLIGSVKGNIGHTEPSAGLCSLVKVMHALNSNQIPPNIHFDTPREGVEGLIEKRLKVVTEVTPFPKDKVYAGINSFGFGGANCHAIVKKFDKVKPLKFKTVTSRLVCYSGRSQAALDLIHDNIVNCNDVEYLCLLQESFKTNFDNHMYRGYTIVGRNLRSSMRSIHTENNKIKLIIGSFQNNQCIDHLKRIPMFKTFLDAHVNSIPKEATIPLMLVHSFKELGLPVEVFPDHDMSNSIDEFFNNQLNILQLSKMLKTQPKLHNIETWINTNSFYSTKGTILLLGCTSLNGYINKKCNFVEFGDDLTEESCLISFGKLYELGFNPQVQKLYPAISFPVGRGTELLSHLLKWRHQTFQSMKREKTSQTCGERVDLINVQEKELAYLRGHLIDNRNLFPATGYIYYVWKLFADMKGTYPHIISIALENIKFQRACTITETDFELYTVIGQNGNFEVSENGATVVTGVIRLLDEDMDDSEEFGADMKKKTDEEGYVLTSKDVYRELRLRGYNYSGQFRAIHEVTQTVSTIVWEQEWVTFLDNMMQVCILNLDTRNLYVPVAIERLVIRSKEHMDYVNAKEDKLVPVRFFKESKTIRSKFVEIRGLNAKSIARRKERLQPVLESYQFIPNEYTTVLATSVRINIQLLLECKPSASFKVAELIEPDETPEGAISNHICNAIEDFPVVIPDMTVVTTRDEFKVPHCETEKQLTTQNLLIVCKSPKDKMFVEINKALTPGGFLLCLCGTEQTFPEDYIILTKHHIEYLQTGKNMKESNNCLYFLRKRLNAAGESTTINISNSDDMLWLKEVQKALKSTSDVVLVAQDNSNSGILGFTNCLNREPGSDKVVCVFIQDKTMKYDEIKKHSHGLVQKQLEKQMKINVFKNGQWGTYRHLLLADSDKVLAHHWYAKTLKPGDLSSLCWMQGHITPETKTPYKILYSALNFRDLMLASGKLPIEAVTTNRFHEDILQGFEFVAIDPRGKRVCAMNNGGISNMTDNVSISIDVPDNWKSEDAATVFVVYITVLYGLIERAHLQNGQSVLIHSGTGGVGLAALNVCTHFKCNIFVTVGTKEKRDYLMQNYPNIKPTQIGNSRNTTFREMILRETNGRGVDLVLNSLAEEKLQASVDCLAVGGVFVEIGKYDLEKNNELSLDLALKECRHIGVMLDTFGVEKSNTNVLLKLWNDACREGYIKPLPKTIFQMNQLDQAYKYLSTGKHIGKVIIQIDHEREHKVLPRYYCDPNKTYIVFGGLGGFGLELADWLVLRGAKHIVLSSRNGITTGYQQYRITTWKSYGVEVSILTEDVTNYDTCYKALKDIHTARPIDGTFNLAVVLNDSVFENQTVETMQIAMKPKAILTQHLDQISRLVCPKMKTFVVFSSVTCGRGNAGQTNYGYSNSVMERICEQRHLDGLPALAVQWGAVGDVGLLEALQKERNEIVIGGTLQQKVGNCLEVLDAFLLQSNPIVSSMLVAEKFNKQASDSPVEAVIRILGVQDVKSVSPHTTFPELGMDSMMAVEIKQTLERDFDILLTQIDLRNLTFSKLEELSSGSTSIVNTVLDSVKYRAQSAMTLAMMIPAVMLASTKEKLVDYNKEASKTEGDFILVFPGIDADIRAFEVMSKSMNKHLKVVNYDEIAQQQENVDVIVDSVYNAVKNDIKSYKTFKFLVYSIGNFAAIEMIKRFEAIDIFGKLVLLDGAPELSYRLYDSIKGNSLEEMENNVIKNIFYVIFPRLKKSGLKEILMTEKNRSFKERVDRALMEYLTEEIQSDEVRAQVSRLICSFYSRLMSVMAYKARKESSKIKSCVHLYKPTLVAIKDIADDYKLGNVCENLKSIKWFEGNHLTMLYNDKMHKQLLIEFDDKL